MVTKLQDLPVASAVADTDIIFGVATPATTPTDKKVPFSVIKSFLKTYFDNIYQAIGAGFSYTVQDKTDDYPIVVGDLGIGRTITMNNVGLKTFTLPTLSAGDLGKQITLVKKGAGQLTIQAGASQKIADSGATGTIYDAEAGETYATITLIATTTTQWNIVGINGTWTTTDPLA